MAVGNEVTKLEVNSRLGAISKQIHKWLDLATDMDAWLDGMTEQNLVDLGFTSGEVAVMKSAFTDLAKLAAIYHGDDTQAAVKDFTAFTKQLHGVP